MQSFDLCGVTGTYTSPFHTPESNIKCLNLPRLGKNLGDTELSPVTSSLPSTHLQISMIYQSTGGVCHENRVCQIYNTYIQTRVVHRTYQSILVLKRRISAPQFCCHCKVASYKKWQLARHICSKTHYYLHHQLNARFVIVILSRMDFTYFCAQHSNPETISSSQGQNNAVSERTAQSDPTLLAFIIICKLVALIRAIETTRTQRMSKTTPPIYCTLLELR